MEYTQPATSHSISEKLLLAASLPLVVQPEASVLGGLCMIQTSMYFGKCPAHMPGCFIALAGLEQKLIQFLQLIAAAYLSSAFLPS